MALFAREAKGDSPGIHPIGRPISNFSFIDQWFPSFRRMGPLRRLFSQARAHQAITVVIEDVNPADARDLAQENEDLSTCLGAPVCSRTRRVSFFDEALPNEQALESVDAGSFIGYAIVKEDELAGQYSHARVYESVMRSSRQPNNFVRSAPSWQCRVGGRTFQTTGYLYAQQNDATNVCAHVACRTAASRFHPDGDMTYREMNDILGIDHTGSRVGRGHGLTSTQMRNVLEAAGARCDIGSYPPSDPDIAPPFQKLIYGSIESGYPAIVCFATERGAYHAVPIFGHTFNEDMWVPHAESFYFRVGAGTGYIPSESWLSSYLAHDDNWGSNYCIPRHFMYTRQHCRDWPGGPRACVVQSDCVAYILATLPKEVDVTAIEAELIGVDYLFSFLPQLPDPTEPWKKRLLEYASHRLLVVRPILLQGSEYLEHLAKLADWDYRPLEEGRVD
jgi:hypothetical protein